MTTSPDGGTVTATDLVAFYRYVMERCDQADQWQKEGQLQWAEEELSHLGYRLRKCASVIPDDDRAWAITEAMKGRIGEA